MLGKTVLEARVSQNVSLNVSELESGGLCNKNCKKRNYKKVH